LIAGVQDQCVQEAQARVLKGPLSPWPIDLIPGRGPIDHRLVGGLDRRTGSLTRGESWDAVSRSLIAGIDLAAEEGLADEHEKEYRHFCRRLLASFRDRDRFAFDRWLMTESQQSFLRLLSDAHKLRGDARKEGRKRAQAYYRLQLWAAYQQMARAYGALMLIIWLDFCFDKTIRPTLVEQQLFSAMHRPQFYLGGLPLAFFPPPQLSWVIGPLLDLWGRECFTAEAYDPLTQLLGIYGATASERRAVDRNIKANKQVRGRKKSRRGGASTGGHETVLEEIPDESSRTHPGGQMDSPEDFPEIISPHCPRCGQKLNLFGGREQLDERWSLVLVQCPRCDEHPWYARIDLSRFVQRC
jgi:hypothetical protein